MLNNKHAEYISKKKLTSEEFISDLRMFNFFYEFMSQHGLLRKYKKHLDIGGQEGYLGFLCQSVNLVDDSLSVDIKEIEENKILRIYIYYKFVIKNFFSKYKSLLRFTGKYGFVNRVTSIYNKLPLITYRGKLETSMKNVFELNEKFDLITSISSLDFFKTDEIMSKIYNLLSEGGICYMHIGCYWYLKKINENNLKFWGEIQDNYYKTILNIQTDCPPYTVEDYCKLASKAGFEVVSIRRNIQGKEITKRSVVMDDTNCDPYDKSFIDMLNKAKHINKNVSYEDLRTLAISLILKKS